MYKHYKNINKLKKVYYLLVRIYKTQDFTLLFLFVLNHSYVSLFVQKYFFHFSANFNGNVKLTNK